MNTSSCKLDDNYCIKIYQYKVYVDYSNSCAKIVNFHNISVQNINRIVHFAAKENLGKVICNCDANSFENFINAKFHLEGKIDGYFQGEDAFCMSYFIRSSRKLHKSLNKENLFLVESLNAGNSFVYDNNFKYEIRDAKESDAKEIAKLFSNTFFTSPSLVHDEEYLKKTMNKKTLYKVAVDNGKIISVASADLNSLNLNAEITNCATYPKYRCKGVLSNIVYSLELNLKNMGFICLYSLARSISPGINLVLSKHGYKFRGRLINNSNICGTFEDVNIWVKNINNDSINTLSL